MVCGAISESSRMLARKGRAPHREIKSRRDVSENNNTTLHLFLQIVSIFLIQRARPPPGALLTHLTKVRVESGLTEANKKRCQRTEKPPRKPYPSRSPLKPICGKLIRYKIALYFFSATIQCPGGSGSR